MTLTEFEQATVGDVLERCGLVRIRRDRVRLRTVMAEGIVLGQIVDVVLDASCNRIAGFELRTPDRGRRFAPLGAVTNVGPCGIEISSPLHLVDEVDFYRAEGLPCTRLIGTEARAGDGRRLVVEDVEVRIADGSVAALVLDSGERVPIADVAVRDQYVRVS